MNYRTRLARTVKKCVISPIKLFFYFKHGHVTWIGFILSMCNFIVITYTLLIREIPILHSLFPNIAYYALIISLAYFPICTIIGWIDIRRGLYRTGAEVWSRRVPAIRDLVLAVYYLSKKLGVEESVRVLEKWVKDVEKL